MKKEQKGPVTGLAVISLIIIAGLMMLNYVRNRQNNTSITPNTASVLGEKIESLTAPTSYLGVKQMVQESIQSTINITKESVSQKVIEAEKSAIETINQEIANLTKSQVEAFKIQICRDLGVLPSLTPASNQ